MLPTHNAPKVHRTRSQNLGLLLAVLAICAVVVGLWGLDRRVAGVESSIHDSLEKTGGRRWSRSQAYGASDCAPLTCPGSRGARGGSCLGEISASLRRLSPPTPRNPPQSCNWLSW
jgi:hypothetical protein